MNSFSSDLIDGKTAEDYVAKLLYKHSPYVTQGKFESDLIITRDGVTSTIEVKWSRKPEKYIAVEYFNLNTWKPTCIAVSKADYWVNVISEKPDFIKKSVWIINTRTYRELIKEGIKNKSIIMTSGGDLNNFLYVNIPIDMVKNNSIRLDGVK